MKKLAFVIALLLTNFIIGFSQSSFLVISDFTPSNIAVCDSTYRFGMRLYNPTPFRTDSILLDIKLPTGVEYIPNSVNFAFPVNTSNPNRPIFYLDSLSSLNLTDFNFSVKVNCNAFNTAISGNSVSNNLLASYKINGQSYTQSHTTNTYTIVAPNVSITNITNQAHNGAVGASFSRCFTISNNGTSRLDSFNLREFHGSGISVTAVSAGSWISNLGQENIALQNSDFSSVGNSNNYLDPGESITFCQTIMINSCDSVASSYELSWGCDLVTCQTDYNTANVNFLNETPNLKIWGTQKFPNCIGNNQQQKLRVTNLGNGDAVLTNLRIFNWVSSASSGIDPSSITYLSSTGAMGSLNATGTINNASVACTANSSRQVILQLPTIAPGDTLTINFTAYTCCQTNCRSTSYHLGFRYEGAYSNNCGDNFSIPLSHMGVYKTIRQIWTSNIFPAQMVGGQTQTLNYRMSSGGINLPIKPGARLKHQLILPPCLTFTGNIAFTNKNGTTVWAPDSVLIAGDTINAIFNYPAPFAFSFATLTFDVTASCASCGSGTYDITFNSFYYEGGGCSCARQTTCYTQSLYINCPAPCNGLAIRDFTAQRENLGESDNNNDGVADLPPVVMDTNKVRRDRLTYGDTLVTYTYAKIEKSSGSGLNWNYLYAENKIEDRGNAFSYVDADVTIYKQSGVVYTCNNTIPAPTITTSGTTRNFKFDLSPATIGGSGCVPNNNQFENGDSIVIKSRYVVSSNIGGAIISCFMTNNTYVSNIANPVNAADKYFCGEGFGRFTVIGYYFTNYGPNSYNILGCDSVAISQNYYLSVGPCCNHYAGGNLFENEFRNFAWLDSMIVVIPQDYQVSSVRFRQANTTGNGTISWSAFIAPSYTQILDSVTINTRFHQAPFGGSLPNTDEGFYGQVQLWVVPTCNTKQDTTIAVTYDQRYGTVQQLSTSPTSTKVVRTTHDKIYYDGPDLFVQAVLANVLTPSDTVKWEVSVSNLSLSQADNVWLGTDNTSNFQIIGINEKTSGIALPQSSPGIFDINTLAPQTTKNYEVYALIGSCSTDTLNLFSGWDCRNGIPTTVAQYNCEPENLNLVASPLFPFLVPSITLNPNPADLCDTITVNISGTNTSLGNAYDLKLILNIPSGLSIVNGTSRLKYPNTGSFNSIVNPSPAGGAGTSFRYNLSAINSIIGNSGLKGSNQSPNNLFNLQVKLLTDCSFTSGSIITATLNGDAACGSNAGNSITSQTVYINNATQPYLSSLNLSGTYISPCDSSSKLAVAFALTGNGTSGSNDSIRVKIPLGTNYIAGSAVGVSNPPAILNPDITNMFDGTELRWKVPAGIYKDDTVRFTFKFEGDENVLDCEIYDFKLSSTSTATVNCATTGSTCNINVLTGDTTQNIFTYKAYFNPISATGCAILNAPSGETIMTNVKIKNNGEEISSGNNIVISYYNDVNNDMVLSNTDILLFTDSTATGVLTGDTLNFIDTFNVAGGAGCGIIAVIDTSVNACVCEPIQIYFTPELKNSAGNDTITCSSAPVTFGPPAITGYTYSWMPSSNLTGANTANPTMIQSNQLSNSLTLSYVLTTTRGNCTVNDTIQMTIHPELTTTTTIDTVICLGESINLMATGGNSYQWSPAAGLTCVTCPNPIASPTVNTKYYVTITDTFGCNAIDSVTIAINNAPNANAGNDFLLCKGDTSILNASGGTTYQWTPNYNISCTNCASPSIFPDTSVSYIVQVSDANGCSDFDTIYVTVGERPIITKSTTDTICFGDTTSITVLGGSAITWMAAANLICDTCFTAQVYPTTSSYYSFIVSDSLGCTLTDSINVIVNNLPTANAGADVTICFGDSILLTGNAQAQVLWSPSNGITCNTCNNTYAAPITSTSYVYATTDNFGCTNYDTINVTVTPLPPIDAGPGSTFICPGDVATINANGGTQYLWTPNYKISCDTCASITANPDSTTTYYLQGTDSTGCVNYDSITVIIGGAQNTVLPNVNQCIGDTVQLFVAAGASNYKWSPNVGLSCDTCFNPMAHSDTTINYTIIIGNSGGCSDTNFIQLTVQPLPQILASPDTAICASDSAQLVANGGVSYIWSPSVGLSCSNCKAPKASPPATQQYVVEGIDSNGCSSFDTLIVTINNLPSVDAGPPSISICPTDSTMLMGMASGTTWQWTPNQNIECDTCLNTNVFPTTRTKYYLTTTNIDGCSSIDSITVFVGGSIVSNFPPRTNCAGDTSTLTSIGVRSSYQWTPNYNISCDTCQSVMVWPDTSIVYKLVASNASGCADTINYPINIHPSSSVNAGNDNFVCIGDTAFLNASGGANYQWSPASSVNCDTCNSTFAIIYNTTTFYLNAIDSIGCRVSDSVTISIHQTKIVDAGPPNFFICDGDSVQTTATIGMNSYSWSPVTNISCTNCPNPHFYPNGLTTYVLNAIDSNGCESIDSVVIQVGGTSAGFRPDVNICEGDTALLTSGAGATSYLWTPAYNLSCDTCQNTLAYPDTSTTYTLISVNPLGCTDTSIVRVVFNPNPTINAGLNTSICIGDSTQLLATGGISYNWTPSSGLSCTSCDNPMASPTTTTTYIVEGTDSLGCINTDTVIVTVNNLPIAVVMPDSASVCPGDSIQLNASGGLTYSWSPTAELSCTTCANPKVTANVQTDFIVTVIDTFGCQSTDTFKLFVSSASKTILPKDTICEGDSILLVSTLTGSNFVWSPVATVACDTCQTTMAAPITNTIFSAAATSLTGCVDSQQIEIIVNPNPAIDLGNDVTICAGDTAYLNAIGIGTIVWLNNYNLSCDTCSSPLAYPDTSTQYIAQITDAFGCVNYDTILVSVNAKPSISKNISSAIICPGDSIQLNVTGNGNIVWTPNTNISCNTCLQTTVWPAANTTYNFTFTDSNGCEINDSIIVRVSGTGPQLVLNYSGCVNDSLTLNAPGGAAGYIWNPTTGLSCTTCANPEILVASNITYEVYLTNASGCVDTASVVVTANALPQINMVNDTTICLGDSITISASGIVSYNWSPNINISCTNCASPQFYPTINQQYFVTGIDSNGCEALDSLMINVTQPPNLSSATDTITICPGDIANLMVSGASDFIWDNTSTLSCDTCRNTNAFPMVTTTYTATGFEIVGCESTISIIVEVLNGGQTATNNYFSCAGDSVQLNSAIVGTAYAWSPAAGLSCTTCPNPKANVNALTTYMAIVTNAAGCTDTNYAVVDVKPLPTLSLTNDTTICLGDSLNLNVAGASTYNWSPNQNISCINCDNPTVAPISNTIYYVTATDTYGCVNIDSVEITVASIPTIQANYDTAFICASDTIHLSAMGGTSYSWSPAVGLSCTNCSNPIANPAVTTTYVVEGFSANGCSSFDTLVVQVGQESVTTLPTIHLCDGDSAQLNAGAGGSIVWTPSATLTCNSCIDPVSFTTVNQTYIAVITNPAGCIDSVVVDVEIHQPPVIATSGNVSVCINDTVNLSVIGNGIASWSPSTGLSCINCANLSLVARNTTTYYVTLTDTFGCTSLDSLTIDVLPFPNIVANVDTAFICQSDSVQLSAAGGSNYLWSPSLGLSCTNCPNPIAQPSFNTTYTVRGEGPNGCENYDTVVVLVGQENTSVFPDQHMCIGDSVLVIAGSGANVQWNNTASLSCGNCPSPYSFADTTTTYTAVVTNPAGCIDSIIVTVVVHDPSIANVTGSLNVCFSDTVQLNVPPGGTVSWQPTTGLSCTNCPNPYFIADTNITYYVSITDSFGCVGEDSVDIIVNPLPSVTASGDTTICIGETVGLNASSAAANYNWTPTNGLSCTNCPNPMATVFTTTVYTVEVTDGNGCTATDDVTVSIFPLPLVDAGADASICFGDSIQLNGMTNVVGFSWVPNVAISCDTCLNPWVKPTMNMTYYLTAVDTIGCTVTDTVEITVNPLPNPNISASTTTICVGDTLQLTADGVGTYSWSSNYNIDCDTCKTINAYPTIDTVYTLIITDSNGCVNSESISITVNPLPSINLQQDSFDICIGDTIQFNANGGTNYNWTGNSLSSNSISNPFAYPDTTTLYTVNVIDNNGCENTAIVYVEVHQLPTLQFNSDTIDICVGDSAFINVSGADSYYWINNAELSASTSATVYTLTDSTTMFYVRGTDLFGCQTIDSVLVMVHPIPQANAGEDLELCHNDMGVMGSSEVAGLTYLWTPSTGLDDSSAALPSITIENDSSGIIYTTYTLTVTNPLGCATTDEVLVAIHPLPQVDLQDTFNIVAGQVINIGPNNSIQSGVTYEWVPANNLNDATVFAPFANPTETTKYILVATSIAGCMEIDTTLVIVRPQAFLSAPNAFTPNRDGKNDLFRVLHKHMDELVRFEVYNRWGEMVYENTGDFKDGWDGMFNGELQEIGNYVYYAEGKPMNGYGTENVVVNGSFILLR